jgi:lipopolysaccharide heptosyltransferase II
LKILLVRLRQIGDVVFTTPAIRALRERYPGAHITYIVEPAAAAVVEPNPHVDTIIIAPRRDTAAGVWADVLLAWRLRRNRYDIAIDFHGGPRAAFLTWSSGAPVRIGYDMTGRAGVYTRRVARSRALRARHSVENQWDLLEPLGIDRPAPDRFPIEIPVDADAARSVATRLADCGVGSGEKLVIVHVSAGNAFRRWPVGSFAEVAAAIASYPGTRVIVTSGPSEPEAAARVIADARGRVDASQRDRILSPGEFSIAEIRALVDRAALFIGGDSGPVHVAAASRVPIITLYGPTLPERSAPWRPATVPSAAVEVHGLECRPCDQRVCIHGDFRCLGWIEPRQVIDAAGRLVNWDG